MIASFISDNHREWDAHIHEFQYAYNTCSHATTGRSPTFLIQGREINAPKSWRRLAETDNNKNASDLTRFKDNEPANADLTSEENEILNNDDNKTVSKKAREVENARDKTSTRRYETRVVTNNKYKNDIEQWTDRMKKLSEVRDQSMVKIEKEKARQMKYYNVGRREKIFEKDTRVFLKNHILSSAANAITKKFSPKYIGPFFVDERVGENVYFLKNQAGKRFDSTVHAKDLKLANENEWDDTRGKESTTEEKEKKEKRRPGMPRKIPIPQALSAQQGGTHGYNTRKVAASKQLS